MHTVAELNAFRRTAHEAGMADEEISDLVSYLAANLTAGEEMSGTGGCRKVRWAGRGKGKSGGYRTITFYTGTNMPVFLVTVFGKGEKSNLTQGEKNQLKELTKLIAREYAEKVTKVGARR
jgi:hypothetical protein